MENFSEKFVFTGIKKLDDLFRFSAEIDAMTSVLRQYVLYAGNSQECRRFFDPKDLNSCVRAIEKIVDMPDKKESFIRKGFSRAGSFYRAKTLQQYEYALKCNS